MKKPARSPQNVSTDDVRNAFMRANGDSSEDLFDDWLATTRTEAAVESLYDARKIISQYLSTAEKWRYDKVLWAFSIMLGEISENTPEPEAPNHH